MVSDRESGVFVGQSEFEMCECQSVCAHGKEIQIYECDSEGGGEGGSRLSVNMRRGREGEGERMMGDKKENLDTFMPVCGSRP